MCKNIIKNVITSQRKKNKETPKSKRRNTQLNEKSMTAYGK